MRSEGAARVLHTSDWHLGVSVRNHSRADDHDAAIAEIVGIAGEVQPDLIIHTGDLFDGHRPPMLEFGRAIRALRSLGSIAPVVLIAGNHDSAVVLDVLADAVDDDRITIHARPTLAEKGAVSTFSTAAGVDLRLAVLPFVHANRVLRDFADFVEPNAAYTDNVRKIIGHLSAACFDGFDPAREVAVFASHLHVTGARTSSEREIHVSTNYATDPTHLRAEFGYLAFGHIHVPQAVGGGRGRYAGSILEVDFGEEGEAKQVVVVDLEPGRPAQIATHELTAARRLRRVREPLSGLAGMAADLGNAIVEVTVLPEPSHDLDHADDRQSLAGLVADALPGATVVSVIDGRRPHVALADAGGDEADGSPPSIPETFRTWLASAEGAKLLNSVGDTPADPERVVTMFDELHAAVLGDEVPVLAEAAQLADLIDG